jgi:hypothetical protein
VCSTLRHFHAVPALMLPCTAYATSQAMQLANAKHNFQLGSTWPSEDVDTATTYYQQVLCAK